MTKGLDKALDILIKKYQEGRLKNRRWSQRAFAKRLGISPGALSEILRGKRPLSLSLKRKFATKLELSPQEEIDFFEVSLPSESKKVPKDYHQLNEDQFCMIADWWHYAILNLVKTKDFQPSNLWISKRLGLAENVSQEAWERLFRLGHLKWKGNKVVRQYPRLQTTDGVPSRSVQKAHVADTRLIAQSILQIPLELRDHTSMTLVVNKKDILKAKELIRLFQDKFAQQIHTEPGEEVYKLSVSLFPLSKISEEIL